MAPLFLWPNQDAVLVGLFCVKHPPTYNQPNRTIKKGASNDTHPQSSRPVHALKKEKESFADLGIDLEEKAFYDILRGLAIKYDFSYPEEKLLKLAKAVKVGVDEK